MSDFSVCALQIKGIIDARDRIVEELGADWPTFEEQLRKTLDQLTTAREDELNRLVIELMLWGMKSPAKETFRSIGSQSRVCIRQIEGILDARERIVGKLDADRPRFEEQLQNILEQLAIARVDELLKLVDQLMEWGLHSPAEEIFKGIASQSRADKKGESVRLGTAGAHPPEESAAAGVTAERLRQLSGELLDEHEKRVPRYANVGLFDDLTAKTECDRNRPLVRKTEYYLRINIGELAAWDTQEDHVVWPDKYIPPSEIDGHWLDVIVTSEDFDVEKEQQALFLPDKGKSWVCNCERGAKHHCESNGRDDYLHVPVTSPDVPGEATLRIGFYFKNNLLQCRLFTAQVGTEVPDGKKGYESITDYTLTRSLRDVGRLPPRTLNIFTNENADGSHRVVVVGTQESESENYVQCTSLGSGMLKGDLEEARAILLGTQMRVNKKAKVTVLPDGREEVEPSDNNPLLRILKDRNGNPIRNAKERTSFMKDLRRLAWFGWDLWYRLFGGLDDGALDNLKNLLQEKATIQISRAEKGDPSLLYPWALVYDIPLQSQGRQSDPGLWDYCELLQDENWKPGDMLYRPEHTKCPKDDGQNHRANVICPFGFWGFRHIIEYPPLALEELPLKIAHSGEPKMLVGFSERLKTDPRKHVSELESKLLGKLQLEVVGRESKDENSSDEILRRMGDPDLGFVYLYCHGLWRQLFESAQPDPAAGGKRKDFFLEVGKEHERIAGSDILFYRQARWPRDHWQKANPLVFINGCETVALTPDTQASFVRAFINAHAGGVIGTEVTVYQDLASEAAELFFSHFLESDMTVGEAIRRMRFDFLRKGTVTALAYTPYCSANLHLGRE